MDSRYSSKEIVLLNQLIDLINKNLREQVDDFLLNDNLCEDAKSILQHVYQYVQIQIDLNSILCKQNFLSTDIVLLPNIQTIVIVIPEDEFALSFATILHQIKSIMIDRKKKDNAEHALYKNIQKMLFKYDLDQAFN